MLLIGLALATASPNMPRLGGFFFDQTLSESQSMANRSGDHLVPDEPQGPFQEYFIVDSTKRTLGTLGFCRGRLIVAALGVPSYSDFTTLLRLKLQELGQPRVSFASIPSTDGSKITEELTFTWKEHFYKLSYNPNSEDGSSGNQAIGVGLGCK